MKIEEAYEILGLPIDSEISDVAKYLDLKKSQLLKKEFAGEDIICELKKLEEAWECIRASSKVEAEPEPHKNISDQPFNQLTKLENHHIQKDLSDPFSADVTQCFFCGHMLYKGETVCEGCGKQLFRHCPNCGEYIIVDRPVCNYCHVPVREYDKKKFAQVLTTEQRIKKRRLETEIDSRLNEKINIRYQRYGWLLWSIIILFILAICYFSFYFLNNY